MALVAAVVIAGCGGDGETTTVTVGSTSDHLDRFRLDDRRPRATHSRSRSPAEDGSFDARAIYEKASPGVVTVISVFDNASGGIFGGAEAAAAPAARAPGS